MKGTMPLILPFFFIFFLATQMNSFIFSLRLIFIINPRNLFACNEVCLIRQQIHNLATSKLVSSGNSKTGFLYTPIPNMTKILAL